MALHSELEWGSLPTASYAILNALVKLTLIDRAQYVRTVHGRVRVVWLYCSVHTGRVFCSTV